MGGKPRPSNKPTQGQRVGYARVSTTGQNIDAQLDMLRAAGCAKTFTDTITGTARARPGWDGLIEYIRPGDTLVISELSRMSRSLLHLLQVVDQLADRGVEIASLRENIDTATATGRLFLSIMGAVAQMERELRAERAAAGREAARARGRSGGRPQTAPAKLEHARILYESQEYTAAQAAKAAGISRRTLFAYLASRSAPDQASIRARERQTPSTVRISNQPVRA